MRRDRSPGASPDDDGERPCKSCQLKEIPATERKIFSIFFLGYHSYNVFHVAFFLSFFFSRSLSLSGFSFTVFGRCATSPTHDGGRGEAKETGPFFQWAFLMCSPESWSESFVGHHSCRTFVVRSSSAVSKSSSTSYFVQTN